MAITAPYHGKRGTVTWSGGRSDVQSWDLTTSVDTADTTAMSTLNDWMTQEIGLTDFTANTEWLVSSADDNVALMTDEATLVFGAGSAAETIT